MWDEKALDANFDLIAHKNTKQLRNEENGFLVFDMNIKEFVIRIDCVYVIWWKKGLDFLDWINWAPWIPWNCKSLAVPPMTLVFFFPPIVYRDRDSKVIQMFPFSLVYFCCFDYYTLSYLIYMSIRQNNIYEYLFGRL